MERAAPARARVSDAGPARLLAGVVGAAARLCGARLASISLLTEGRDHLELRSVFGTGGVIAEHRLPVRQSLNGTVITSARSFRSRDVWRDRRPVVREIARRNRTRGVLIVPLATREVMPARSPRREGRPGSSAAGTKPPWRSSPAAWPSRSSTRAWPGGRGSSALEPGEGRPTSSAWRRESATSWPS